MSQIPNDLSFLGFLSFRGDAIRSARSWASAGVPGRSEKFREGKFKLTQCSRPSNRVTSPGLNARGLPTSRQRPSRQPPVSYERERVCSHNARNIVCTPPRRILLPVGRVLRSIPARFACRVRGARRGTPSAGNNRVAV